MTEQERIFFEMLTKDRSESADTLEKPSMRGIKNSVVEKYSDQAHFIYELLQNADDAKATKARFILEKDCLIFAHNGSRHFSVSNPETEDEDSITGLIGDINAITSIANSNKKREATIGKFGVGFKAVFQYTATPHIYDPNFRFRIDRFIVPTLLDKDFEGRDEFETLFVFPFDHKERSPEESYSDISDKLKKLSYPLLFLSELKNIEFEFCDVVGHYAKNIDETQIVDDMTVEHITLTQNDGDEIYDKKLWLFSREEDGVNRRYSVGFFLNDEGQIVPSNEPAFCFFPTKEVTNLNFIVHAAFLLNDSREGIRAGVDHNDYLIELLAELAADALVVLRDIGIKKGKRLIDDNVVEIIPISESVFTEVSDKRKISFKPFYVSIRDALRTEKLLPTRTSYIGAQDAYWASVPQIAQLFSDIQLAEIVENVNARWVFTSLGRDGIQSNKKEQFEYLDSLVRSGISEDVILNGRARNYFYNQYRGVRQELESIKGISGEFIEGQEIEWLHSFYKWISETKHRTDIIKNKAIFLDQHRRAVSAYDDDDQLILFLPIDKLDGYTVVNEELLNNKETRAFIEGLGVKEPSLKDQIYNTILPLYDDPDAKIETLTHFKIFFDYYCNYSSEEVEMLIGLIKDCAFLDYSTKEDDTVYRGVANSIYIPTKELLEYFETCANTRFLSLDKYVELVGYAKENKLIEFLTRLGVKNSISVDTWELEFSDYIDRDDLPEPRSTRGRTYYEPRIDGCEEIVNDIVSNHNKEKSILLWNSLLGIIEEKCTSWGGIERLLRGSCEYFYYYSLTEYFVSIDGQRLKNQPWIMNEDGDFVSASDISRESLSSEYKIDSEYAEDLLDFLEICDKNEMNEEQEDDSNLTDSQREKIEFANKLQELGITKEDLEDIKEFKKQKEAKKNSQLSHDKEGDNRETQEYNTDELWSSDDINNETYKVVKDILEKTSKSKPVIEVESDEIIDVDSDEFMPSIVDYSTRLEKEKQRSAIELEKIAYEQELQNKALSLEKYSFGWFKTLLEMECQESGKANSNSREISISFTKVEREPKTQRTFVLRYPNRNIPQFMEDLADIPLVLHLGEQTKTLVIEVANISSFSLRVKLRYSEGLDELDLDSVTSATINAKSPVFLLEELKKQFMELEYADDFNMKDNLCKNIEFIFGPPGTGKTTHIAKNVLIPLMENENCRVLVLTPTNKAADVIVNRIAEVAKDNSYEQWLVRFGSTVDESIEQSSVYKEKTFDIRELEKNVTVTTIARFPYDFFMPEGKRIHLNGINWDYIVIDEASMIPLVNIIYPLYKKTPTKFIIAGDPFQIEPISMVDIWKDENIYKMVQLNSFVNPTTVPVEYKVELLTTQYRSVPQIGEIFSKLAYGGILKHHRDASEQRKINFGDDIVINTLNIIKYPVSKYESIYNPKRLNHSSAYHIYCALFTFEYVSFIAERIANNNPGEKYNIGIIAPYRAQSDMIDKLVSSAIIPDNISINVSTIHGFQGDECDIIFAVFNAPPNIPASDSMFLNKKNIINVSISRARDYLFIIMPDDNTEKISNLKLVKRVENFVKASDDWVETATAQLEQKMFNDDKYLEKNTFATSHQSVNVYGLPEKCYEIRTEDSAVDVQIHKNDVK